MDKDRITLRRATIEDISNLIEIEKSVSGDKTYSALLEESEWKEEMEKGVVYIIEDFGSVAGNISYERKSDNHFYISGLAIRPEFQGRGIAREALLRVLEELYDARRIDLVTHPDNVKALSLYQSLGFLVEQKIDNYFGDGEPRIVLALHKK